MKRYSQHGQDLWVLHVLDGKRGGFFLDTGAYEPILDSNTYLLEKEYDWRGICVEPNKILFDKLRANRKYVIEAALSSKPGFEKWISCGGLSGFDRCITGPDRERVSQAVGGNLQKSTSVISTISIQQLFDFASFDLKIPETIDYWSLDTEGSELELLESFPWDGYKVKLLTVEHNGIEPKRTDTQKFLKSKGYTCFPNLLCPWEDHFVF
jgi:hypothetical protein